MTPELEAAVERAYQRLAEQGFTHPERSSWNEFSNLRRLISRGRTVFKRGTQAYSTYIMGKQLLKSFDSARKASQSTMKSVRKRLADFGQFERKVKRQALRDLGFKYRTKRPAAKPPPAKKKKRKILVLKNMTPPFAVASHATRFRKGKRPNISDKFVKRHFDDYGAIERDHSLWIGFQTHGSRERIMQIASEALLRALLSRVDFYPTVYDQTFANNGTIQKLVITWRHTNADTGGVVNTNKTYTLAAATFEAVAAAIRADWYADDDTVYQGCPVRAVFYRNDYSDPGVILDRAVREVEDLDRMKLKLFAKQVVRVQNLSPNDAGTAELDVNGTNPIQGKIYEFTTPPKVREKLREVHGGVSKFADHLDPVGVLYLGNITETGVDGILGHPPPAGGLFTNCRKVANIRVAAGAQKYKTTLYKFEGTVEEFGQQFRVRIFAGAGGGDLMNHAYKKHGGGVFWMGLEQSFRQGSDKVKIGFNRELSLMGRAEFAKTRPMLRHYEQTDMGDVL